MYIRCFYCYFSSIEMFLNNLFSLYLIFDLLRFVFDEILFHFFQITTRVFIAWKVCSCLRYLAFNDYKWSWNFHCGLVDSFWRGFDCLDFGNSFSSFCHLYAGCHRLIDSFWVLIIGRYLSLFSEKDKSILKEFLEFHLGWHSDHPFSGWLLLI